MPFLPEHFSVIEPNSRLNPHNIGFGNALRGLFLSYNQTLTCFKVDHSIRWQLNAPTNIEDFCIDQANKLLFYTTAQFVYAISLETGIELWSARKDYSFTNTSITCSPKNKLVFCSQISGSYQYIYVFTYLGSSVKTVYRSAIKVRYLDKSDRLLVDNNSYVNTFTKDISDGLTIANVSGSNFGPSIVSKKDADKVFVYSDSSIRLSVGRPVAPVELTKVSDVYLYKPAPTDTVAGNFIYFSDSDSNSNYQSVVKIDLSTGQVIYRKRVRTSQTGLNRKSVTQDADRLYQITNPETPGNNNILVVDKVTGDVIRQLSLNPHTNTRASEGFKILHTYDSLT